MLTKESKRKLTARAHDLQPVILTGNKGITDNLIQEMHAALEAHELIKVRVNAADREARLSLMNTLAEQTSAELVKSIGHIGIYYRRRKKS